MKEGKILKKRHIHFIILTIINVIIIINIFNIYNIKKQRSYYIGRIESMDYKDGFTSVKISPVSSNRYFISEVKANHHIEYADNIGISGLSDQSKNSRRLKLGELGETIDKLKVGDTIIFKVENGYDKNKYNFEVDELSVDLTLE